MSTYRTAPNSDARFTIAVNIPEGEPVDLGYFRADGDSRGIITLDTASAQFAFHASAAGFDSLIAALITAQAGMFAPAAQADAASPSA